MQNLLNRKSPGDVIFDVVNTVVMLVLMFVTLYPMYYVLVASVTNNLVLLATPGFLWYPKGFTLGSFKLAFTHPLIMSGYKNILIIMGGGFS